MAAVFSVKKKWKFDPFAGYDKSKMSELEQRRHLAKNSHECAAGVVEELI